MRLFVFPFLCAGIGRLYFVFIIVVLGIYVITIIIVFIIIVIIIITYLREIFGHYESLPYICWILNEFL